MEYTSDFEANACGLAVAQCGGTERWAVKVGSDADAGLINLASLRDYEGKVGARRHRRRFRANIWFSGAPAWNERSLVGQQLQVGGALLRVTRPITRCAATEVNPETAKRDAKPLDELRQLYGHVELGVHAEVMEGGRFAVGDAIELLPE